MEKDMLKTENDTVALLRECDAGAKMGAGAIDDVMPYVKSSGLRDILIESRRRHIEISDDVGMMLKGRMDDGKEPGVMAKSMAWVKTNVRLSMNESDSTVADLITDGCAMGVKNLRRYTNKYDGAESEAADAARRLVRLEEKLTEDIACFL
jgi:hypothetical protein